MIDNPKNVFEEIHNIWVGFEERARKGNFRGYQEFLVGLQKTLTKCYAKVTKKELVELVEFMLKEVSCKLKEISIKSKDNEHAN